MRSGGSTRSESWRHPDSAVGKPVTRSAFRMQEPEGKARKVSERLRNRRIKAIRGSG